MKVCILTKNFAKDTNQGVFKYVWNTVKELQKKKNITMEIQYNNSMKSFIQWFLFDNFILLKNLFFHKADIYHATMPEEAISCFFLRKIPLVTTLYDIILIKYPKEQNFLVRMYFRWSCFLASRSRAIITISDFSKQEIIKSLGIPKEKIIVAPCGFDKSLFKPRKDEPNENFIGYLGGFNQRKNVPLLLKSFKRVTEQVKDAKLIIGGTGRQINYLKKLASVLGLDDKIKFIGFIKENELADFYSKLKVFVYPSSYEGFGIPPLEAMACGVPVIVSNRSSLPEVVGDAGIKVNPTEKEIFQAIISVLQNDDFRKALSKKSIEQANEYSWKRTAEITLKVYKRIIKKSN